MSYGISIFGIPGIPEIQPGDDIPEIILEANRENEIAFQDQDIVVIAQKIVSKAEGCIYHTDDIKVSVFARHASTYTGHPPEYTELVLRESKRIVRMANGMIISQTHHGFVTAGAGVDRSNSGGKNRMLVLPRNPDLSAQKIKQALEAGAGKKLAVIISDTFGRPWRNGQTNQAIGIAGLCPIIDYRGQKDDDGCELRVTQIAVADELASAAELISGKTNRTPVVVIRGYPFKPGAGTAKSLVREEESDIFK